MTGRRFFFVFEATRAPCFTCAIYEDEMPTPSMLKHLPRVLYKAELLGRWHDMTLSEIVAEYERRRDAGKIPPSNIVPPPPAEKRKEFRVPFEQRKQEIREMFERRRAAQSETR